MNSDLTPELREEIVAAIVNECSKLTECAFPEIDCNGRAIAAVLVDVKSTLHFNFEVGRHVTYTRKVWVESIKIFIDESPVEVTPEVRADIQAAVNEQL